MRDMGHSFDLIRRPAAARSVSVMYALQLKPHVPDDLNEMLVRLITRSRWRMPATG
jgi:hypothetical protein